MENRLEGACHISVSILNRLRREGVAALELAMQAKEFEASKATVSDLMPIDLEEAADEPGLSVQCRDEQQLEAAIQSACPVVYLDYEDPRRYKDAVARFRSEARSGAKIVLATPRILKPGEEGYLKLIERATPDGLLLRNHSSLGYFREKREFFRIGDFSLNVANPVTARMLMEGANLDRLTVSYDLNISQVLALLQQAPASWFELTIHQHMPMFHMEHCAFCVFLSEGTSYKDCGRPCESHEVYLRDRVGQKHRLMADVGCRNTLFNGRAQTGARYVPHLLRSGLRSFRLELLDQRRDQSANLIELYQEQLKGTKTEADVIQSVEAIEKLGVTEGAIGEV